ncbi:MAG: Gfo/Idh/MocA family oxidoreductase [Alphaproteobacteria bacterium]|nr:Gfo/Idh/MocA family oxidoreductase [Alphaproteobacteria bacterium]MBU1515092.1 Gfo/Idh/MocA family oxidoreductase [Alphaproteobacteria bacterium]MBU2093450.1 Gfo/Idh/MocA family oxidoreductase [Alphaproteobacteria bacterium]MBU2152298.1 Gfo/Idh/MocA family oxidoreductase [Alphaproteobacteria bacterium]MBU2308112.1 Gfo/Idh/MocA family oxidoreductase [Alphaproteobacteria bacterium]
MTTYRIGVIGLGQRIAHVLAAMKEVGWNLDIVGHVDPAPVGQPILEAAGLRMGLAFTTPAELMAAGPFDLLMLGAPNHLHFEHLSFALDQGVPIFAEKPIVRTEDETDALARRLAAPGAPPVHVGLVMRSLPIVREVLARIDRGELGEVVSIDATEHLPPEHGGYLARNWRRKQEWGGSYFLDKVVHDFDIFGRIAGARPDRVASFGGRRIFTAERRDPPRTWEDGSAAYALRDAGWAGANDAFQSDMDVTDHQVAMVEYANDVRLSFHANSHTALTERRWYVAGTDGTLIADLVRNKLMVRRALNRGKPEKVEYGGVTADAHNGADQAMALDLLAALEGRAAFPVTPYESMEAGLTVMAIDQAMAERQVVDCAPMWTRYDAARSGVGEQRVADQVL